AYVSLSTLTTQAPRSSSAWHTAEPMKPAPPVTRTRINPFPGSIETNRQVPQQREYGVLGGKDRRVGADRPRDRECRIRPGDAALVRGRVERVDLVKHRRVRLQGAEAVSEAGGHEQLLAGFGGKFDAHVVTVARGGAPNVDAYVQNAPGQHADEFGLGERRNLKMHTAYGARPERERLVVLYELARDPGGDKVAPHVSLGEIAPRIAEAWRPDQLHVGMRQRANIDLHRVPCQRANIEFHGVPSRLHILTAATARAEAQRRGARSPRGRSGAIG